MGPLFAGILGTLGFSLAILRGVLYGEPVDMTVSRAVYGMIALAVAGYLLGRVAAQAVDESVEQAWQRELAEREQAAADQEQEQTAEAT